MRMHSGSASSMASPKNFGGEENQSPGWQVCTDFLNHVYLSVSGVHKKLTHKRLPFENEFDLFLAPCTND